MKLMNRIVLYNHQSQPEAQTLKTLFLYWFLEQLSLEAGAAVCKSLNHCTVSQSSHRSKGTAGSLFHMSSMEQSNHKLMQSVQSFSPGNIFLVLSKDVLFSLLPSFSHFFPFLFRNHNQPFSFTTPRNLKNRKSPRNNE